MRVDVKDIPDGFQGAAVGSKRKKVDITCCHHKGENLSSKDSLKCHIIIRIKFSFEQVFCKKGRKKEL